MSALKTARTHFSEMTLLSFSNRDDQIIIKPSINQSKEKGVLEKFVIWPQILISLFKYKLKLKTDIFNTGRINENTNIQRRDFHSFSFHIVKITH